MRPDLCKYYNFDYYVCVTRNVSFEFQRPNGRLSYTFLGETTELGHFQDESVKVQFWKLISQFVGEIIARDYMDELQVKELHQQELAAKDEIIADLQKKLDMIKELFTV